jgi:hypothetical protein
MHRSDGELVILEGQEVSEKLDGRELELRALMRKAYETHAAGTFFAQLARSTDQHC